MNREEANFNAIANALGKDVADATYKMEDGSSFYDRYGGDVSLPSSLTNAQIASGNEYRYVQEQVSNFNQGGHQGGNFNQQAANNGISAGQQGYEQSTVGVQSQYGGQGYGVNSPREWKMESNGQATSQYYDRLPKVYNRAIVKVRKNGRGNVEAFQLEDGTVLDYAQMLQASNNGAVAGLRVQTNREGELILRSVPDGFTDNNLDNLPQF